MSSFLSKIVVSFMVHMASLLPDNIRVSISRNPFAPFLRSVYSHEPVGGDTHLIVAGPARGYKIVTDHSINRAYIFGTYEPENVKVIKKVCRPGMTAIDIGAHEGYLTLVMANLISNSGKVFAFEPLPQNYHHLKRTISLNKLEYVIPYQMAISDGKCRHGKFSINPTSSYMGKLVSTMLPIEANNSVDVEVQSIDEIAITTNMKRIDLVKIDVEGEELKVLDGMREVIREFFPDILIEFHSPQLLEAGLSFLGQYNYKWKMINPKKWGVFASQRFESVGI